MTALGRLVGSLGCALALAAPTLLLGPASASAQYVIPGPPAYGSVSIAIGDFAPQMLRGIAGGAVSLSSVDSSCRGTADIRPSHVIMASGPLSALHIQVQASADSTLMVQLPDGRRLCDDDSGGGLQAMIETSTIPGPVYVWVGSYSGGSFPYQLSVSQVGMAPPPTVMGGGRGIYGDLDLGGRWSDPTILTGSFGGPVSASTMSSSCRGYISPQASHVVMVPGYMPNLRFVVSSSSDTTLVVQYADGRIACDDDGGGSLNPLVEGPATAGPIRVWVGSYSGSGTSGPYMLGVTTNPGVRYDNLRGAPVYAPPPPVVVTPPPVVVTPPSSVIRVTLDPRVPVTLYGPGITTSTVAVWSPRGGSPVEFMVRPSGGTISIGATVGGVASQLVEIPAALASTAVITATRRADGQVLFRAERAPEGVDLGQQMLLLVSWSRASSAPQIAQQWIGTFSDSAPRWSR